jgi:hypothetical protein
MSMKLVRAGVVAVVALAGLVSGCGNSSLGQESSAEALGSTGTLNLPLTAQSAGVKYRLASAKFTIRGTSVKFTRTIAPPADLAVDQETLAGGDYQITLEKGWQLQAKGPSDANFVGVDAQLTSPNPASFTVQRGKTVDVVFTFASPGGKVSLNDGRANVRISVQDCESFDTLAASIATFTVDCLGHIDQNSYLIGDDGFLRRNFDDCPLDRSKLQSIDDFLGLQYPRNLPGNVASALAYSKDCIAGRYAAWRETFAASGIQQCPDWKKVSEVNTPTAALYDQFAKLLPPLPFQENGQRAAVIAQMKINSLYSVSFTAGTADPACQTPGACAAQCAGGFPGFVIRQDGETVLTDPTPWQRDTIFTTSNPFTRPGYYHPMSLYGALPGDIFSHINRTLATPSTSKTPGEYCSYWDGTFHLQTQLVPNCADMPDGTTSCVGICAPPLVQ